MNCAAHCAASAMPVCPVLDALGIDAATLERDSGAVARALQRLLVLDPKPIRPSATIPAVGSAPIGASLLATVRDTMANGQAFLVPRVPGRRVMVPADVYGDLDLAIDLNRAMGWHDGAPAQGAAPIGYLTHVRKQGSPLEGAVVALLSPTSAFVAATRAGYVAAESAAAWSAVWREGLAVQQTAAWQRNADRRGRLRPEVRVRLDGEQIKGVPVLVGMLLDENLG